MRIAAALLLVLALAACGDDPQPPASEVSAMDSTAPSYPETRRGDVVDDYFGTRVPDPYRWLEALDSEEVADWVAAQNAVSRPFLEALPRREALRERATTLWTYETWGVPMKRAGLYFYEHYDGDKDQPVLLVSHDMAAEPRVLLDPNTLSEDATVALVRYNVSPDGRYLGYALSDGGSDWVTLRVREIATGRDLDDVLTYTKFTSPAWTADGKGFFYERYPLDHRGGGDDTKQTRVYYHVLGEPQRDDRLFYEVTDHPTRNPSVQTTDDGRYLLITLVEGYFENAVYYVDLTDPEGTVRPLFDDWDGLYESLGNSDSVFWFRTTSEAPNGRIIAVDLARPRRENWRVVVPEAEMPIYAASLGGERVVLHYLEDAHSVVRLYGLDGGAAGEIPMPGLGTAYGTDADKPASGDEDRLSSRLGDDEVFFGYSSYTTPPSVYRYALATGEVTRLKTARTPFDGEAYVTKQVFYASGDGTRVPMFITHRRGLEPDGEVPTLLYGYGGFNVALTPEYGSRWALWLETGGVLAVPNLRGGGEYGEGWHAAGARDRKQNVFDDFIAAAEWLIANGYTRPEKLAIFGGSNGGLLVGAVMTQRPRLFGAAIPAVGVLDMLRYHTASANARMWSTDYGLSENAADFRAQIAYSPVHNVTEGACYPPTLIQTADHDDRVVPWHSFKFAAALQHAQGCDNPVLIRIETRAGHGAGKPIWMRVEEEADRFAFVLWALGENGAR